MNPTAEALLGMLKVHEGYRQHPYNDSGGVLSIGYGRNLTANGISESEASYLLINDMNRAWSELDQSVPAFHQLDDVRKSVLVDMTVNMGIVRVLRFVRMLEAVAHRNYPLAAQEMADSLWAGQVGTRAVRLAEMMRTGNWPAGLGPVDPIDEPVKPPSTNWLSWLWRGK